MVRLFLLLLLVLNFISCRNEDTEVNSIKIVNNSNDDVVILLQRDSFYDNPTNEGGYPYLGTRQEYRDHIKYRCINAHSYKYLNNYKIYISELFVTDTLFMGVFNRLDYDTLSREEFKTIYPIKHEYKITLQYMQDQDWTIIYPPIVQ